MSEVPGVAILAPAVVGGLPLPDAEREQVTDVVVVGSGDSDVGDADQLSAAIGLSYTF